MMTTHQLVSARFIVLGLAATMQPNIKKNKKNDRRSVYLALKTSNLELEPYFEKFGLYGRFRKRRLVSALFESPRLAPVSAHLIMALRDTLLYPRAVINQPPRRSSSLSSILDIIHSTTSTTSITTFSSEVNRNDCKKSSTPCFFLDDASISTSTIGTLISPTGSKSTPSFNVPAAYTELMASLTLTNFYNNIHMHT
mmetsp:Transcript_8589/g.10485  ORF Transcript_8589/g.10485 Transcript_8589/m.10485 type:complete len:197 (+) Transcript_8589:13-603(+)